MSDYISYQVKSVIQRPRTVSLELCFAFVPTLILLIGKKRRRIKRQYFVSDAMGSSEYGRISMLMLLDTKRIRNTEYLLVCTVYWR